MLNRYVPLLDCKYKTFTDYNKYISLFQFVSIDPNDRMNNFSKERDVIKYKMASGVAHPSLLWGKRGILREGHRADHDRPLLAQAAAKQLELGSELMNNDRGMG